MAELIEPWFMVDFGFLSTQVAWSPNGKKLGVNTFCGIDGSAITIHRRWCIAYPFGSRTAWIGRYFRGWWFKSGGRLITGIRPQHATRPLPLLSLPWLSYATVDAVACVAYCLFQPGHATLYRWPPLSPHRCDTPTAHSL